MLGRAQARARRSGMPFQLTLDNLFDLILSQGARCAYSGVCLELVLPNSDWRVSLERIDNSDGYVASNCVMVACEFNTADLGTKPLPGSRVVEIKTTIGFVFTKGVNTAGLKAVV